MDDLDETWMLVGGPVEPRTRSVRRAVVDDDDLIPVARQGLPEDGAQTGFDLRSRVERRDHDTDRDRHRTNVTSAELPSPAALQPGTERTADARGVGSGGHGREPGGH